MRAAPTVTDARPGSQPKPTGRRRRRRPAAGPLRSAHAFLGILCPLQASGGRLEAHLEAGVLGSRLRVPVVGWSGGRGFAAQMKGGRYQLQHAGPNKE